MSTSPVRSAPLVSRAFARTLPCRSSSAGVRGRSLPLRQRTPPPDHVSGLDHRRHERRHTSRAETDQRAAIDARLPTPGRRAQAGPGSVRVARDIRRDGRPRKMRGARDDRGELAAAQVGPVASGRHGVHGPVCASRRPRHRQPADASRSRNRRRHRGHRAPRWSALPPGRPVSTPPMRPAPRADDAAAGAPAPRRTTGGRGRGAPGSAVRDRLPDAGLGRCSGGHRPGRERTGTAAAGRRAAGRVRGRRHDPAGRPPPRRRPAGRRWRRRGSRAWPAARRHPQRGAVPRRGPGVTATRRHAEPRRGRTPQWLARRGDAAARGDAVMGWPPTA